MSSQTESYLRDLQNRTAELLKAYHALALLEQRRVDVGITPTADDLTAFPHLTTDNITNAQFAIDTLKTLMTTHRANFERIVP